MLDIRNYVETYNIQTGPLFSWLKRRADIPCKDQHSWWSTCQGDSILSIQFWTDDFQVAHNFSIEN